MCAISFANKPGAKFIFVETQVTAKSYAWVTWSARSAERSCCEQRRDLHQFTGNAGIQQKGGGRLRFSAVALIENHL